MNSCLDINPRAFVFARMQQVPGTHGPDPTGFSQHFFGPVHSKVFYLIIVLPEIKLS